MKIKRLVMSSFRGIGDMTIEFDPNYPAVIIGVNGVGKSSILDCLAILMSRLTSSILHPTSSGRLFREEDITNGHKETHNQVTIVVNNAEVTWSLAKVNKRRSKETNSNLVELRKLLEDTHHHLKNNPLFNLSVVVYYAVNRAVIDIPLKTRKKSSFDAVTTYDQALNGVQINFNHFFEWFRSLEDLENEERRDNPNYLHPQLEAVRQAIYSILPGFSNLRVRRSPLRMTVVKQDRELIINQLSDGEKCLLAMVGDLARRLAIANPSLPQPLQGHGIVLIDEIELHLHPKWQREIIPALTQTFPNCQFIITTHSPQVISHVKPHGVYILERMDTDIYAYQPESSFGRDSNSILEDLMKVSERPQQTKDNLRQLFHCIDLGNLDKAKQLRQNLAAEIGDDEQEFVRADILIRRKEILSR